MNVMQDRHLERAAEALCIPYAEAIERYHAQDPVIVTAWGAARREASSGPNQDVPRILVG